MLLSSCQTAQTSAKATVLAKRRVVFLNALVFQAKELGVQLRQLGRLFTAMEAPLPLEKVDERHLTSSKDASSKVPYY